MNSKQRRKARRYKQRVASDLSDFMIEWAESFETRDLTREEIIVELREAGTKLADIICEIK